MPHSCERRYDAVLHTPDAKHVGPADPNVALVPETLRPPFFTCVKQPLSLAHPCAPPFAERARVCSLLHTFSCCLHIACVIAAPIPHGLRGPCTKWRCAISLSLTTERARRPAALPTAAWTPRAALLRQLDDARRGHRRAVAAVGRPSRTLQVSPARLSARHARQTAQCQT